MILILILSQVLYLQVRMEAGGATLRGQGSVDHEPPFDRADYVRRLAELPGDWPPPEELRPR